jgi:hypothetical protein
VSSQEDAAHTEQLNQGDTRLLRHQTAAEAVDLLRILVLTVDRRAAPPSGKPAIHVCSLCECILYCLHLHYPESRVSVDLYAVHA